MSWTSERLTLVGGTDTEQSKLGLICSLGVAYTFSHDPDLRSITIIHRWPGAGNQTRPKVPTEISYDPSDKKRWGWQLRAGSPRYGGFKLLLDPGGGSRAYNDEHLALTLDPENQSTQLFLHPGKSATDMVSDYLRLVHKEVMESLQRRFPNTLNDLKIKFVITTPAMWSPAAQHNTMMAASTAGFGSRPQDIIESVTEPEAAASYALREFNSLSVPNSGVYVNSGWQVGKQIIMCDAGGGTVDLVSYEIDQVKPYLRVSETTRPRGKSTRSLIRRIDPHRAKQQVVYVEQPLLTSVFFNSCGSGLASKPIS
ncbi:hypothetical protein FCOIX_10043 [Fusarium coicis]|nr:hypothetical protein FCOIX_10043 [Fusarium coicis]